MEATGEFFCGVQARTRKEIKMIIEIKADGIWFHGSNIVLSELREGSTITQWKELAEAFSHQPTILGYDDNGNISHNGKEKGYLYIIDEPVEIGKDIYQHPRTTMDENAEFLNKRVCQINCVSLADYSTHLFFE